MHDHYFDEEGSYTYKRQRVLTPTTQINLGKHEDHDWDVVTDVPSPHVGKIICNTCGGKWVTWLPKGAI